MAFKFISEPVEFFTEWRNGSTFVTAMTESTYRIRGNVGDLCQMQETVTVECSVNETLSLPFIYNSTNETIVCAGLNFYTEGLFIGATVEVIQGANSGESTIENITSNGFSTIFLDTTNLSFLIDGLHTDVWIRVKDAPTFARFEYGLIPDKTNSDSEDLFASPLDGNIQAYYLNDVVTPSYEQQDMIRFGKFKGTDLTTAIKIAFVGTTDDYYHEYEIVHTFRIPFYREEERDNILRGIPPAELSRTNTLKYGRRLNLGFSSEVSGSVLSLGTSGDVGYYGENYNGRKSNYTLASFTITNSLGTGRMRTDISNTISAKITNTDGLFDTSQKVIIRMFKLAQKSEYENNEKDSMSEIFVFDSVVQEAGASGITSNQIRTVRVIRNDANDIDISFNVELSSDQQSRVYTGDVWVMSMTTGENGRPPVDEDVVALTTSGVFEVAKDVDSLITNVVHKYYDSYAAFDGARVFTNQATWNGCGVAFEYLFRLVQYNTGEKNRILSAVSRMVLTNDSDDTDISVLWSKDLPITPSAPGNTFLSSDYSYQLANGDSFDTLRLPEDDPMNQNIVRSLPSYPAGYQQFLVQGSVPRIPWRDWIQNLNIPTVAFDADEPFNNLNQKTSNLSALSGYSIRHELFLTVQKSTPRPPQPGQSFGTVQIELTDHHLQSDPFSVIDFDEDGNPSVVFTGEVILEDTAENEVDTLSSSLVRTIKVEIEHDQGILDKANLWAEIWIEDFNSTGEVWALHSHKDWSSASNQLTGSQKLSPANFNYVEIESENDLVTLYCSTAPENLNSGIKRNIYYRLGKKIL